MKKISIVFLSYFLLTSTTIASAQNIRFIFTDNTEVAYPLNQLRNITFTGDVMNLNLTDNSTISWNVNLIAHYEYDESTNISEPLVASSPLNIYPNPSAGLVTITYELIFNSKIIVEILDLQGNCVGQVFSGMQKEGKQSLIWNTQGKTIANGTYLCRLINDKHTVTKPIIIQQ